VRDPSQPRAARGVDRPPSNGVRAAGWIVTKVDEWISSLASADVLAAGQLPDPATHRQRAALGRRLTDTQHKIASLIAAIESGVDPTLLGQQLATRTAEKDGILREIGRLEPTGAMTAR